MAADARGRGVGRCCGSHWHSPARLERPKEGRKAACFHSLSPVGLQVLPLLLARLPPSLPSSSLPVTSLALSSEDGCAQCARRPSGPPAAMSLFAQSAGCNIAEQGHRYEGEHEQPC